MNPLWVWVSSHLRWAAVFTSSKFPVIKWYTLITTQQYITFHEICSFKNYRILKQQWRNYVCLRNLSSQVQTPLAMSLEKTNKPECLYTTNHEFHETCHSITFYFMKKRFQTMQWHHNAWVNSHQRWKQTRFRVCFHLWCELTSTMNATELQVSRTSWGVLPKSTH